MSSADIPRKHLKQLAVLDLHCRKVPATRIVDLFCVPVRIIRRRLSYDGKRLGQDSGTDLFWQVTPWFAIGYLRKAGTLVGVYHQERPYYGREWVLIENTSPSIRSGIGTLLRHNCAVLSLSNASSSHLPPSLSRMVINHRLMEHRVDYLVSLTWRVGVMDVVQTNTGLTRYFEFLVSPDHQLHAIIRKAFTEEALFGQCPIDSDPYIGNTSPESILPMPFYDALRDYFCSVGWPIDLPSES